MSDLEEKHRQANATIKEKEYIIANLLRSGERNLKIPWCIMVFGLLFMSLHNYDITKSDFKVMFIFSEKALIDRAIELRAELETAASDIASLFAKIGWYIKFKLNSIAGI